MPDSLTEGENAPDFRLINDKYDEVGISDYLGKNIVLYFYPKDNTPGCTQEAIDFTELRLDFEDANTIVMGVSKDEVEQHEHFKDMKKLDVMLLSDPEGEVIKKYGVWVEKNMYGKKYMGIERSTFLIDSNGKIVKIWRKVRVKGHVDAVLEEAKKLA